MLRGLSGGVVAQLLTTLLLLAVSVAIRLQDSARLRIPEVVPDYQDARETNSPSWLPVRSRHHLCFKTKIGLIAGSRVRRGRRG